MKRLIKSPKPALLVASASELTRTYIASGHTTRPWAHRAIKDALIRETDKKCAYCEAAILAVSFGDIEHILPKSEFPDYVVDWENLTLVCSRCNQHKGSKHDPDLNFVNPYTDQIEEHLLFLGALAYATSDRGTYSLIELQLNEPNRIESRERVIQNLEHLVRRYGAATDAYTRKQLARLIELQALNGEYTASVRSYLKQRLPEIWG